MRVVLFDINTHSPGSSPHMRPHSSFAHSLESWGNGKRRMCMQGRHVEIIKNDDKTVPSLVIQVGRVSTETANVIGVHFVMSTIVRSQHISEC